MSRLTIDTAEALASKMRTMLRVANGEPLNMKTVVRQLNVMTVYRPLSDSLWGLSLKSPDGKGLFMLVNSNTTRGRQHFTIAHELFHLFFDENPTPHFCCQSNQGDVQERSANMFASALLMPREGLCQNIPSEELLAKSVSVNTILRLEHLYGVSHTTMVLRLKELKLISQECTEQLLGLVITKEASWRGYDGYLYRKGNEGLVIGDFGTLAKRLYDAEKISEGHFVNLLNMIGYGEGEDSIGC